MKANGSKSEDSPSEIILASASPRRKTILERMGYSFRILVPDIEETIDSTLDPEGNAERLARMKTHAVADSLDTGLVIGCDTIVAVENRILGKPASAEDAFDILSFLSGKTQRVISGICLKDCDTGAERCGHDVTRVFTKPMSKKEIDEYIATGECFGKAGAYAIQETGDRFIERIEGSFDNVVGFPSELFARYFDELFPGFNRD